ncbi:Ubiquitin-conjugating enzyme E2 22 [Zostera marina]|uniref:E2 ubiquitin-conjugating enzyme n=1 Tax=Zostera marina TaxID=29655 RepID=A0A0K9PBI5_ZOSMR|nr:Ubiquitin-conjugating enzyme E2 22 [Zostera marina]
MQYLEPTVIKQLAKELKNLNKNPLNGIDVIINDEDLSTIVADIDGPVGTPYENGIFRVYFCLSNDFPNSPPKGYFQTKIFHPNISTTGEICVNTLKKDWNPIYGLRHILVTIRCLLIEPYPESALNEQASKLLLDDYQEYVRCARIHTEIHSLNPKKNTQEIYESTFPLNVNRTTVKSSSTKTSEHNVGKNKEKTNQLLNLITKGFKEEKVTVKKTTMVDDIRKRLKRL